MASSRFDPRPSDKSSRATSGRGSESGPISMSEDAGEPTDIDLLAIIGRAEQISKEYHTRTVERPLNKAYRAWQNQHAEGSKYLGTAWKGRSRLFVPKTRSAVRKNLATAAASLFSTEDVVNITAQFEDDPQQRATAAVIKADLDYRLTRSSPKSGVPWYLISMGGCLDAQLTGVTISKQFWEFAEVPTGETTTEVRPLIDPLTQTLMIDPQTGEPMMEQVETPVMRVVKDRPMVELHPIENIGVDPAAPWYAPIQLGRWFYCRYPMGMSDAKAMLASGMKGGRDAAWLDVPDELLSKGRIDDERAGVRRVREGGGDRYEEGKGSGALDIVWLQENFVRVGGKDYHFWSVGRHGFLSKVRETHEAYPELDGERPYVMGVSQLDTHRVFPQSPVETWQPLQLELNDVANLRLDTLKRSIAPLAVVKRGKNVDLNALQRRGQPDAMLLVDSQDDVAFTQTPGPGGAAYTETSVTNSMFDELAGVFSTSSVQSNRQLNETVGGMRMMSGAANAVSEFDLRMWIETWVEPVMRHLTHLVRFYETDERILAIAGQNARAWTRFEYMPSIDDFDQTEVTLRVNAGIGALDPMQKLSKLKAAMDMLGPLMGGAAASGIQVDLEAIIEEVMGAAGFRDGRRFFKFGEPPPPEQDPKMQQSIEELKLEREKLQQQLQQVMLELQSAEKRNHEDNMTAIQIAEMRGKHDVIKQLAGIAEQRRAGEMSRQAAIEDRMHATAVKSQDDAANRKQRIFEMLAGGMQRGGGQARFAA